MGAPSLASLPSCAKQYYSKPSTPPPAPKPSTPAPKPSTPSLPSSLKNAPTCAQEAYKSAQSKPAPANNTSTASKNTPAAVYTPSTPAKPVTYSQPTLPGNQQNGSTCANEAYKTNGSTCAQEAYKTNQGTTVPKYTANTQKMPDNMKAASGNAQECCKSEQGLTVPIYSTNIIVSSNTAKPLPLNTSSNTPQSSYSTSSRIINTVLPGSVDRAEKMLESPYDFGNWLTMGAFDTIKGAVSPKEPFSTEHLVDSALTAGMLLPIGKAAITQGKQIINPLIKVEKSAVIEDTLSTAESVASKTPINPNPFKGKTPAEIDQALKAKGYEVRGSDPVNGYGGYVNPNNGRSYHIDPNNSFNEAPHVDVNRLRNYKGPLEKKKLFTDEEVQK